MTENDFNEENCIVEGLSWVGKLSSNANLNNGLKKADVAIKIHLGYDNLQKDRIFKLSSYEYHLYIATYSNPPERFSMVRFSF